MNTFEICEYEW